MTTVAVVGATSITLNGPVYSIVQISQGQGPEHRIGRKVVITQVTILGYIYIDFNVPTVLNDVWNNLRYGLAVVPGGYGVYNTDSMYAHMWDSSSGTLQDPHLLVRNLNETNKIKMILDRKTSVVHSMYTASGVNVGAYQSNFKRFLKIKKKLRMEVVYNISATGSNPSSIEKNWLYFWYFSDSTTTPHPTLRFVCRVKFLDT